MNDLINRKAAIDAMADAIWHYPNECYKNLNSYELAKTLAELGLKSVPSAQLNAVPVVHGKWIYTPTEQLGYRCSVCGKGCCRFNYCPNCGADMRGEQNG